MSVMTEYGSRPQDVGEILVKVHDDLQQLREKLLAQKDREDSIDLSALDNAITKTEYGLRNQAEQVLKQVNNQVRTLPSLNDRTDQHGVETTWDTQSRGDLASRKTRSDRPAVTDFSSGPSGGQSISLQRLSDGSTTTQPTHSSPGEQFKQIRQMRVLQNPHNPRNREVVHDNYGIQLPLINTRGPTKPQQLQILKGSTVDPLVMLPRANRADPQLLPPPISEKDAQRGILSLLERGLIPPAAQLTLDPPPVVHQTAPLHDPQTKDRSVVPFQSETNYSHANVKRDPHMRQQEDLRTLPSSAKSLTSGKLSAMSPDIKSRASSGAGRKHSAGKLKTPVSIKTLELPFQPFPPPTTPASGPDLKDKSYRFAIQNGKVRDQAQEFIVFKHHYCLTWGSIVSMLKQLEKMLKSYAVPIAFINGSKLADLSIEFELERSPTVQELLTVIVNREDVENIINRPGRRFVGPNGRYFAASKIQATYRMHLERQRYLDYRKKKWAAGVIAISWVMHVKMSKVRRQMATTKADQIENFRKKAKAFCKNWGRIKNSKRVVIHIPSLGYSLNLRQNVADFSLHQNLQMARLCDIRDPSVDVIYVSPVPISDEMAQYYSKLLGLKAAIDTGNVEDQDTLNDRFKIITPEAIKSFPVSNTFILL